MTVRTYSAEWRRVRALDCLGDARRSIEAGERWEARWYLNRARMHRQRAEDMEEYRREVRRYREARMGAR